MWRDSSGGVRGGRHNNATQYNMWQLCNHWIHGMRCTTASADLPPATRHFRTWIPFASRGARPEHVYSSRCGAFCELFGGLVEATCSASSSTLSSPFPSPRLASASSPLAVPALSAASTCSRCGTDVCDKRKREPLATAPPKKSMRRRDVQSGRWLVRPARRSTRSEVVVGPPELLGGL